MNVIRPYVSVADPGPIERGRNLKMHGGSANTNWRLPGAGGGADFSNDVYLT